MALVCETNAPTEQMIVPLQLCCYLTTGTMVVPAAAASVCKEGAVAACLCGNCTHITNIAALQMLATAVQVPQLTSL
jgi:hypothetical protein